MNLGDLIKRKRKERGLTQKQLAAHFGISDVSVSEWERNLTRPDTARLSDLARILKTTVEELLGGRVNAPEPNTEPGPEIRGMVPLVSWVQAGQWADVYKNFEEIDAEQWLPCPSPHSQHTFCLRVRGASMQNPDGPASFSDGDIIFVDPLRAADHRKCVVVRLDDEQQATFKQLIIEGERKLLRPLNPNWPEKWIDINGNATIIGTVIGKWVSI
ncbi:S24 family peptidase [Burkholderia gladioli]|uniref:LexA family protein n=1 Tax=Burkholderia gladioli TaxID=28095 RepID=UPI00264E10CF|nr:S24 family peptidase [Burkholderia gladioli]MDN7495024.1 S24 family peptidase [Burkholderia gladioli]